MDIKVPTLPEDKVNQFMRLIYENNSMLEMALFIESLANVNVLANNMPLLCLGMWSENPATVAMILDAGADPNIMYMEKYITEDIIRPVAHRKMTALAKGIVAGMKTEVIQLLLEAGADPNMPCGLKEETPLHMCLNSLPLDRTVMNLLLLHGANIHLADADGRTANDILKSQKTSA